MENQSVEDDDIEFSMIGNGDHKPTNLDFSLNDLLDNPKVETVKNEESSTIKNEQVADGSFMRDLGKMQQQISYETNPYDIYESSQQPIEFTSNAETKQEQTCARTIGNLTKTVDKFEKVSEKDFKHLIFDFAEEKNTTNFKNKDSFEDYLEGSVLKAKISLSSLYSNGHKKTRTSETPCSSSRKSVLAQGKSPGQKHKLKSKTRIKSVKSQSALQIVKNPGLRSPILSKDPLSSKKGILSPKTQKNNSKIKLLKSKSPKKSLKVQHKKFGRQKEQQKCDAELQYFGYETKLKQNLKFKKNKQSSSKSKSKSKGKKIVFSQQNVYTCR